MFLLLDERYFNYLLLKNKKIIIVFIFLEVLKCLLWIFVCRWLYDLIKFYVSFIFEEFFIRSVMIFCFCMRLKN